MTNAQRSEIERSIYTGMVEAILAYIQAENDCFTDIQIRGQRQQISQHVASEIETILSTEGGAA